MRQSLPTSGSQGQRKQKFEWLWLAAARYKAGPRAAPGPGLCCGHTACPTLCGWISAPPLPSGAAQTPQCRRPSLTTPHRPLSCPLTLPYVSSRHLFPPPRLTLIDYLTQNASSVKEETLFCSPWSSQLPLQGLAQKLLGASLLKEGREGGREAERAA